MGERRDTRVIAGVGVILHIGGQVVPCMTRNMSRGGMFVVTRKPVPEGAVIGVEVVHRGIRLKGAAEVVKRTDQGLGLRFIDTKSEFRSGVRALMEGLVAERQAMSEVPDLEDYDDAEDEARLAWGYPGQGSRWKFWEKRRFSVELSNMSIDGASLQCDNKPDVGDEVIVFFDGRTDSEGEPLGCRASVVRHTDTGFAVKFVAPSMEFRRAIADYRRKKFPTKRT